ncbi:hypothetical protein H312_02728 [Anncaliia algerae PRA339]|uniref:ISXO2-like transposase domain-containing protein n=1 Tax=Anncaliia algerae PRA339 TaxID=1288291 RepID=A0A059EXV0_9MICR|nr:hypothetical protein H312_02728 [Anncaliia algerae PRA339]
MCRNLSCPFKKTTKSIRIGSIFESIKLSLINILTVIISWTLNKNVSIINTEFGISKRLIIKIFAKLRLIVKFHLDNDPIRLGGVGKSCQIDESLFCHKVKAHRGRSPVEQLWVFGIVDPSYAPARGYMEIVPDRSAATLLPIIRRICRTGTIIHSDEWAAYDQINRKLGFIHYSVNHSLYFVDPNTGIHTQHIESYWNRQKLRIKNLRGIRRRDLQYYLAEFIWKDHYKNDMHEKIFEVIRLFYN